MHVQRIFFSKIGLKSTIFKLLNFQSNALVKKGPVLSIYWEITNLSVGGGHMEHHKTFPQIYQKLNVGQRKSGQRNRCVNVFEKILKQKSYCEAPKMKKGGRVDIRVLRISSNLFSCLGAVIFESTKNLTGSISRSKLFHAL